MAVQTGKTKLQGRVGNMIYYKMNGRYYARSVSSLSGRRVKRDPKFRRTMEYAKMFGVASKLASELHRSLPRNRRGYRLYRKMTGQANSLLMKGMNEEMVREELKRLFLKSAHPTTRKVVCSVPPKGRIISLPGKMTAITVVKRLIPRRITVLPSLNANVIDLKRGPVVMLAPAVAEARQTPAGIG